VLGRKQHWAAACAAVALIASLSGCGRYGGSASTGSGLSDSALAPFERAVTAAYLGTSEHPPTTAPTPPKNLNLWIISAGQAAPSPAAVAGAAKEAAQALGWKATIFDGQFGANDGYNVGIRQAIAAGADAIIVGGIDCTSAKASLQQAKAAGVPVIGMQAFDCDDPKLGGGAPLYAGNVSYISSAPDGPAWNAALGKLKADWLITSTHGKADVIAVDLGGVTGYTYQMQAFKAEMAKCETCKIVATVAAQPPDLSNGNLNLAFASALSAHPEANAVYTPGDSIVTAAEIPQALQSAGRLKSVVVIGNDGVEQNLNLIRNDHGQNADIIVDLAWSGWAVVDTVIRVLAGQKAALSGSGWRLVDASHGIGTSGTLASSAIDFRADYRKAWGLG
jgi:ribose transport system substrate-binding protein